MPEISCFIVDTFRAAAVKNVKGNHCKKYVVQMCSIKHMGENIPCSKH
jgi:hypothetical protein